MNAPCLVAVVDDDDAVRKAIVMVLGSVGIAARPYACATSFLGDPAAHACQCLVLDVRLPGLSGTELQRRLQETRRNVAIIFVSAHAEVDIAVEAMKRGALDFLPKPFKDQRLIDAVQSALARRAALHAHDIDQDRFMRRLHTLTPRERDVFDGIVQGLRSKEIAAELGIAVKTVEEYRARVFEKMRVTSAARLAALAAASGAAGELRH